MQPNIREATRLLGVYTAGRYDIWLLAGPARASCRAHIMSELCGRKMPQSKSGVTMLRQAFYAVSAPVGETPIARERAFVLWARDWTRPEAAIAS